MTMTMAKVTYDSPVIFLDIDGVRLLNDRHGSSISRIYELIHMLVTSLSLIFPVFRF
jgi:hypothetical protein